MLARWKIALGVTPLAGLPVLFALVVGYGRSAPAPASATPTSAEPAAVTTVHPEYGTLRHAVEQPGQVQGFEQTPLYAKVSGYVRKLNADIGDRVKAGQVLAELSV